MCQSLANMTQALRPFPARGMIAKERPEEEKFGHFQRQMRRSQDLAKDRIDDAD